MENEQLIKEENKADALRRLERIEGQVRGIKKMIGEDRYCIDVLTQVSSVQEALRGVSKVIMRNYLEGCATRAIKAGQGGKIYEELMEVLYKYAK
jgi:DNA-binding FrmR family transcriptional regulator